VGAKGYADLKFTPRVIKAHPDDRCTCRSRPPPASPPTVERILIQPYVTLYSLELSRVSRPFIGVQATTSFPTSSNPSQNLCAVGHRDRRVIWPHIEGPGQCRVRTAHARRTSAPKGSPTSHRIGCCPCCWTVRGGRELRGGWRSGRRFGPLLRTSKGWR